MKKIFLFILIIISVNGFSQTGFPGQQSMANASTRLIVNGGLQGVRGIINGVFTDTTAANSDFIDFYNGAQIYTRSDRNFWLRDSVLNMWIRMAKYSEVGGTDTHIGNTNLTLTANRVLTMDGKTLSFTNSGGKQFFIDPVNGLYKFGDIDANLNTWQINIDDVTQSLDMGGLSSGTRIHIGDNDDLFTVKIAGSTFLSLHDGDFYEIGDIDAGSGNETKLSINDAAQTINFKEGSLAGASVGYVWKLQNTTTGEGGWEAGVGGGVSAADLPLRITGSTVSADTSVAYNPSLTTNQHLQKKLDSLQAVGWGANNINYEPWYQYYLTATGGNTNSEVYFNSATGSGAGITNIASSQFANWMFGQKLTTGTTSAGFCFYYAAAISGSTYGQIAINSSYRYNWGQKIRFEDLSDGTETYSYYAGFINDVSAFSSVTNGAGFRYAHTDSSGSWIAWTKAGGSLTEDAVGSAISADTDYELEVSIIGGTAYFYINKALVTSIATNVPSGSAQAVTTGIFYKKSNGTTARLSYVEWMAHGKRRS